MHMLAAWFIAQHQLEKLAGWLTLSITIALAIQTGKYRLDESVLVGKNGGEAISAARSDAYFALTMRGFSNCSSLAEIVPCIETVLHGAPRNHSRSNGLAKAWGGYEVPSTHEIVNYHSLTTLKALAANVTNVVDPGAKTTAHKGGRFLVLDWLSFPESRETVDMMQAAGLNGRQCFERSQLPDACGYLATGWAALLHRQGDAFDQLECNEAGTLNNVAFIAGANAHLQIPGVNALRLSSDQIIALASAMNPDGPGTSPAWMHSPMPVNLFQSFFARTCNEEKFHGVVHLVVVNTEPQYTMLPNVEGGVHWYLAAWYINPSSDND